MSTSNHSLLSNSGFIGGQPAAPSYYPSGSTVQSATLPLNRHHQSSQQQQGHFHGQISYPTQHMSPPGVAEPASSLIPRPQRDTASRPLNKLTSDLIKTYKNINENYYS